MAPALRVAGLITTVQPNAARRGVVGGDGTHEDLVSPASVKRACSLEFIETSPPRRCSCTPRQPKALGSNPPRSGLPAATSRRRRPAARRVSAATAHQRGRTPRRQQINTRPRKASFEHRKTVEASSRLPPQLRASEDQDHRPVDAVASSPSTRTSASAPAPRPSVQAVFSVSSSSPAGAPRRQACDCCARAQKGAPAAGRPHIGCLRPVPLGPSRTYA